MDLKKINTLKRKAMKQDDNEMMFEVDLILDDKHPKSHWDEETWSIYADYERKLGNSVIYLTGE